MTKTLFNSDTNIDDCIFEEPNIVVIFGSGTLTEANKYAESGEKIFKITITIEEMSMDEIMVTK